MIVSVREGVVANDLFSLQSTKIEYDGKFHFRFGKSLKKHMTSSRYTRFVFVCLVVRNDCVMGRKIA